MQNKPPAYKTYILRVWEERAEENESATTWRVSLGDLTNDTRKGFESLKACINYLESQIQALPE